MIVVVISVHSFDFGVGGRTIAIRFVLLYSATRGFGYGSRSFGGGSGWIK
jgi:hypothetical protein